MAEQFRLEQLRGDGRGIQRNEGFAGAGGVLVQRPSYQLLARAGLTGDENRHARTRQPADCTEDLLHRRRLSDHSTSRGQVHRGGLPAFLAGGLGYQRDRFVDIEWLGEIFEGAALVCGHRAIEIREGGDDDDGDVGVSAGKLLHEFQSTHVGHANIGDDDFRLLVAQCLEELRPRFEASGRHLRQRQCLRQNPANGLVIVHDPDRDAPCRHQPELRESATTGSLI